MLLNRSRVHSSCCFLLCDHEVTGYHLCRFNLSDVKSINFDTDFSFVVAIPPIAVSLEGH